VAFTANDGDQPSAIPKRLSVHTITRAFVLQHGAVDLPFHRLESSFHSPPPVSRYAVEQHESNTNRHATAEQSCTDEATSRVFV
jgi:hypothetical protein